MFEPDENYEYREMIINKLNVIKLNKDNLHLLKEEDIMFIENSNEGTTYVMDKDANLYYAQLEYGKEITRKEFCSALPKYNEALCENQKIYKAINLGMGHVLIIKTAIYDEYMKLLKANILYENEYEDCYNAYCYWMGNAITFLKNNKKKRNFVHKLFEENGKYITQQGLKYYLSKEKMEKLEENINAYANLEMGVEGRQILMHIIIFLVYVLLCCYNKFSFTIGLAVSILIPSVFYYVFDYLRIYKIPLLPFLLRYIEICVFKFLLDKIIMLLLAIFVFDNIWIFVCYIAGSVIKYIVSFGFATLFGSNYIISIRKKEIYYNNKIADYFIQLFK